MFLRMLLPVLGAIAALAYSPQSALAIPFFWEVFAEKYVSAEPPDEAAKKFAELAGTTKCNVCHVDGENKKVRNLYGQALDELLDKGNFGKERLDSEKDKAKAEIIAALEKVAELKLNKEDEKSPTFAANIAAGNLPTVAVAVAEQPAPEPMPAPEEEARPQPTPVAEAASEAAPASADQSALAFVQQLKAEIKAEVKQELTAELSALLRDSLAPELRAQIEGQLRDSLRSDLQSSLKASLKVMMLTEMNPLPEVDDATEQEAIRQITERGGRVNRLAQNTEDKVVSFHLSDKPIDDEALALVRQVRSVVEINARGTEITDEGVRQLAGLKGLKRLNLAQTKVTDAAMPFLVAHPELEYLNLYGTQVTDAGLEPLVNLPSLKSLYLWQTQATEEGAKTLQSQLTGLEVNLGT